MQQIKDFLAREQINRAMLLTLLVAALGYFVDIFDLLLFSVVRVKSLQSLGVPEEEILKAGILLLNTQMAGLLCGGILWGIWGDRAGRVSVLFGSILLYSVANIANGFVQDVNTYAVLRFIAGIGLAGELGAGVTLASELFPRNWRGLGTTFIASIGVLGAVFAALIDNLFDWRIAYIIGGVMGLALLVLRLNICESGMYKKISETTGNVSRGNVLMLFNSPKRFLRYLSVILIGAPIWGVVGLFITFTPEFAKAFGMTDIPKAGMAVLFCYAGLAVGDAISGVISQLLRSRRKAVAICLGFTCLFIAFYILGPHPSTEVYYIMCFLMGLGTGYWAMFVQMGAEQFGTNIRATAAVSIPNMVRALTIPMTAGFHFLIPALGVTLAGVTVLGVMISLAAVSLFFLRETFDEDLDYVEI